MNKEDIMECQNCNKYHITVEKRNLGIAIVRYCLHCYNSISNGRVIMYESPGEDD